MNAVINTAHATVNATLKAALKAIGPRLRYLAFTAALPLLAPACAHNTAASAKKDVAPVVAVAHATIMPLGQHHIEGELKLASLADGGVSVSGEIRGLLPNSQHGLHVHAVGDCDSADGMTAGPHFNPDNRNHGAPGASAHVGDLGNIEAGADGVAHINRVLPRATLDTSNLSLIGRSVILHQDADDLSSQPAGNSGPRIGCGIVILVDVGA